MTKSITVTVASLLLVALNGCAGGSAGDRCRSLALMQAGLAMMSSSSPYASVGIGEGGAQGLAAAQQCG